MAKILLIGDDDPGRQAITDLLESAGHTVVSAADGRKGIEAFLMQIFDIVITGALMPEEGIETIRAILDLKPDIPIIIITLTGDPAVLRLHEGNDGSGYIEIEKKLGASKTIRKPFKKSPLLEAIAACLPRLAMH